MLHVAIVEDEKDCMEQLKKHLETFQREHNAEFQIDWYHDGAKFLHNYDDRYSIVLMDIDMPIMNGMETARRLRKIDDDVCLIFVTNIAQHALEGYQVQAMSYFIKPVTYYQLNVVLQRAMKYIRRSASEELILKTSDGSCRVAVNDIMYVEVKDHFLHYHLRNRCIIARDTMKETEKRLSAQGFARCNNCYLVNLKYVDRFSTTSVFVNSEELRFSRSKRTEFLQKLTDHLGGK